MAFEAIGKFFFEAAHDPLSHLGYDRTPQRIVHDFYIFNLTKKPKAYIAYCPECQAPRTLRYRQFGSLHSDLSPSKPFHTIAIDFILAPPRSVSGLHDCAVTVTDKFSKTISVLHGNSTYDSAGWTILMLHRDSKFAGQLLPNIQSA